MLEFVYHLSQAQSKELIPLIFLILKALCQALLKILQYRNICEVFLCKPSLCHYRQPLFQLTKKLWAVANGYDRFLYSGPGNIDGTIYEFVGV